MAKKRKYPGKPSDFQRRSSRLESELEQALSLQRRGKTKEALEILKALDRRYPDHPEVLSALVNTYADLNNFVSYLHTIRRLHRLRPEDPEVAIGLAGAYLVNQYFGLAYQAFRQFLRKWPNHREAEEASRTATQLEESLRKDAEELGISLEEAAHLRAQHDDLMLAAREGNLRRARELAEQIRRRYPRFVSPLNNLSLACWVGGDRSQAIAIAQQVLEIEPENVHVLGNLIHFLFLSGQEEEARTILPRLLAAPVRKADEWTKKLEALTLLGEEEEVVAVGQQALASKDREILDAMFYCFLAAAEARQGDIRSAQKHWHEALRWDPGNPIAKENLQNLRKKPDERFAPWALPLNVWILPQTLEALVRELEVSLRRKSEKQAEAALQRFLEKDHPELLRLALPMLLRGDPAAKEFVLNLADVSGHPALLEALKEYAFGQIDPLSLRAQAAMLLAQRGVIPRGMTRFWSDGEWRPILLLGFQITGEATSKPPLKPAAAEHMEQARRFLRASDGVNAEKHLHAALAIQPRHPSLLHNLAMALTLQGKEDEAMEIIHRVAEEFPDYFMAQVAIARQAIHQGDLEKARAILDHWMTTREVFHFSEFSALCQAQIELALAEGHRDGAISWLQMWEQVYPDDINLPAFRRRVKRPGLLGWGARRSD